MIQVLERFHKILTYVASDPERTRSISELAGLLGVSSPACANIVKTMVHLGYLESKGMRKGYVLGATPFLLNRNGTYKKQLVDLARPILEKLVKDINEYLVLVTESSGKRVALMILEGDSMIQVKPGHFDGYSNLFMTGTGAVMLSHKSEEEFRAYWQNVPEPGRGVFNTDDYDTARDKCAEIRKQGYFVSEPESAAGDDDLNKFCNMSFPVFEDGKVVAVIGSRVPFFRFRGDRRKNILSKLKKAAAEISNLLGKNN